MEYWTRNNNIVSTGEGSEYLAYSWGAGVRPALAFLRQWLQALELCVCMCVCVLTTCAILKCLVDLREVIKQFTLTFKLVR